MTFHDLVEVVKKLVGSIQHEVKWFDGLGCAQRSFSEVVPGILETLKVIQQDGSIQRFGVAERYES
jgi:hypothetical protein